MLFYVVKVIASISFCNPTLFYLTADLTTDDHDNVDGTIPQTFHYELLSQSNLFVIRNATLYNIQAFDYETKSNYKLKIKVTDSGTPPLSLVKDINIKIIGRVYSIPRFIPDKKKDFLLIS